MDVESQCIYATDYRRQSVWANTSSNDFPEQGSSSLVKRRTWTCFASFPFLSDEAPLCAAEVAMGSTRHGAASGNAVAQLEHFQQATT